MARCKSCSAPLPANTNRCTYCAVRNDVDLHARHDFSVVKNFSERNCPHCEKPLQTIKIQLDKPIDIERCDDCFGLFFDLGEIEALLDHSVSHVGDINLTQIDNINTDRYRSKQAVKYIKCPVCQELMARTNYAQKSGVVLDSCRKHGFWLDSGEITHLMEWKKAGGEKLQTQESQREKLKKPKRKPVITYEDSLWQTSSRKSDIGLETDLLDVLAYVVGRIF